VLAPGEAPEKMELLHKWIISLKAKTPIVVEFLLKRGKLTFIMSDH